MYYNTNWEIYILFKSMNFLLQNRDENNINIRVCFVKSQVLIHMFSIQITFL